jgi:ABC-type Fe3+-siderophore transport system permease subunit
MENSANLKKQGVIWRMVHHPVGAVVGGGLAAAVCGVLGSAHGEVAAAVMAVLGAAVGALFGAMTAASSHREV